MSASMIFINLPVTDLARSKSFYEALGWKVNPEFTDENASCVVIDDTIYLMLLTREYFATFSKRPIADTSATTGAAYALAMGSVAEVDQFTGKALAAGATEQVDDTKRAEEVEVGMHGRTFLDPDGHQWEPFWMEQPTAD